MIKVGVVGYGTIGKRVADAIFLQNDMKLMGVVGNTYNYRIELAKEKNYPIYTSGNMAAYRKHGIHPEGGFKDFLEEVDIVVDCTPKKVAREHKENYYKKKGLKAIFQGGESASIADVSFVAQCNYKEALDKDYVRVVSCNTTGLSRTLHALDQAFGVKKARATLIRRGGDPHTTNRGPINSIIPSFELPSHHGPDVRTVLHNMEVFTTAVIVPTTLMHMHNLSVTTDNGITKDEVVDVFEKTTRVRVIKGKHRLKSTAEIMELARDMGNYRGDMMEICVWEEGIGKYDGELFFPQAVHQESDVVPENIDAIRAAMGFGDAEESIRKTNKSLGLK